MRPGVHTPVETRSPPCHSLYNVNRISKNAYFLNSSHYGQREQGLFLVIKDFYKQTEKDKKRLAWLRIIW